MSLKLRTIIFCLILTVIFQSALCRKRKNKRVRSKSTRKRQKTPTIEKPEEQPKNAQNPKPTDPPKPEPENTKEQEQPTPPVKQETISEESTVDDDKGSKSESQWTKHLDSLMKSKFFRKSKGYYDSLHQCGLDYFERSIEYLSVKSSEYYSVIRQNEAMRNGFLVLIYSFLVMRICSMICSCCTKNPKSSKSVHKTVQKLKKENEQLNAKLAELEKKMGSSPSDQKEQNLGQLRESIIEEVRTWQKRTNEGKSGKDEEEIFTFFHDSLRDLWSEIKSIKSRLRETDVSQLSLNFDPKMFKMDNSKKMPAQTGEENETKTNADQVKSNFSDVLTGDAKDPLEGIKEAVEETQSKSEILAAPKVPTNIKKMPVIKPKIPKRMNLKKTPKILKPKLKPTKVPMPSSGANPTPKDSVTSEPDLNIQKNENPIPVEQKHPLPTKPVLNEAPKSENPEPEIVKEHNPQIESTGNKQEPRQMEKKKSEDAIQSKPAPVVQPKMTPQKPIIKGPRIPTRKIPSRMPINRRIPRKPLKVIKKPTKPTGPKTSAPSQGNMGI